MAIQNEAIHRYPWKRYHYWFQTGCLSWALSRCDQAPERHDVRVLVAGTNAVCVDAVGAVVMGFDPMAERGTAPFENCDSTRGLGEELGLAPAIPGESK